MKPLPIDELIPSIIAKLRGAGAVVIQAEPGAGKTTRVPPAILDAGLAESAGAPGQIVVLQPRRAAARSTASRIAFERGVMLGAETGYQVRDDARKSKDTRILICTDGVFLRRLQQDPLLEGISVVVFDEFHERRIDSDLALALVSQVRNQVRTDLRIVVMSATLNSAPVSKYLGNCPVVESPGRTFPVDVKYIQSASQSSISENTANGVIRMLAKTDGDILAFLPGVGEIRQAEEILAGKLVNDNLLIMPLFGDMPLSDQLRVLEPANRRKIVLATNVAETSLTIDGITAVVDSGKARTNRLDPALGLNKLELTRISKASATQRAGRAGRTAPGSCLRLWTEREHHGLPDFEDAEISRVDLSQSLLQLFAWGEHDVKDFPWYEAPPQSSIERALQLLDLLGALKDGKITELGKKMSQLPLQPRLARLLLEGERLGCLKQAALAATLLSERSPFARRESRSQVIHQTNSDLLDQVAAVEQCITSGARESNAGVLHVAAAKNIDRLADQLVREISGGKRSRGDASAGASADDDAMLLSILASFPDRVCRMRKNGTRRGVMLGGRGVRLSEESALGDECELFVAVEIHDTDQKEALVRRASQVDRSWLPSNKMTTTVDTAYSSERRRVVAFKRTRFVDLIIDEASIPLPSDIESGAILAEGIRANVDLASIIDDEARRYVARIASLREWMPDLELPHLGEDVWPELLADWCVGHSGVDDLTAEGLIAVIQSRLTFEQITTLDKEAPDRLRLPNGRQHRLEYEIGKAPILAVRIQELLGMRETPRIARGRAGILLHLLAPNFRVQQITPDLASFWKNTYPTLRKELRARYPKHAWPEDPLKPQAAEKK
jgi:ATP-dependent helicase HrpB